MVRETRLRSHPTRRVGVDLHSFLGALAIDEYSFQGNRTDLTLSRLSEQAGVSREEVRARLDRACESRLNGLNEQIDKAVGALRRNEADAAHTICQLPLERSVAYLIAAQGAGEETNLDEKAIVQLRNWLHLEALRTVLFELQQFEIVEDWLSMTVPFSPEFIARTEALVEQKQDDSPEMKEALDHLVQAARNLRGESLPESSAKLFDSRLERIERLVEMNAPDIIMTNEVQLLAESLAASRNQ